MAGGSSPIESTTSLFAIPGYSKLDRISPGTPPTLIKTMYFRNHTWKVEVYIVDFDKGIPNCIDVVVSTNLKHSASGTNICIEILDKNWEHTVFRMEQTLGRGSWFKSLTVEKSELVRSLCVDCNDNIPARCTLTFIDLKRQKRQKQAAARLNWWFQLRRKVSGYMHQSTHRPSFLPPFENRTVSGSSFKSNPDEVPDMVERMRTTHNDDSSHSILVPLLISAHG
jgi:hypothetical protein